jgi:hypothetical protein
VDVEHVSGVNDSVVIIQIGAEGGSITVVTRASASGVSEYSVRLRDQTLTFLAEGEADNVIRRDTQWSDRWFWCIWGFWAGEGSLADRGPTGREAQMPYFRPFPVTDESDRTRVCARRRAIVRRCTRTSLSITIEAFVYQYLKLLRE